MKILQKLFPSLAGASADCGTKAAGSGISFDTGSAVVIIKSNQYLPAKVSFWEENKMDPGLGCRVGGCGKGRKGFTGGSQGA